MTGYAILYLDGELVISNSHTVLPKDVFFDYGQFDESKAPWQLNVLDIKTVRILNLIHVNKMDYWFYRCSNLENIFGFENIDVSNATDFSFMFCCCENLTDISVLQNWDVSNGKDFSFMFFGCENLKRIQLPDTLKNLQEEMFHKCNLNLQIHWHGHIYTYADLVEYKKF